MKIIKITKIILLAGVLALASGALMAGDAKSCVIDDKNPADCCKADPEFCDFFNLSTLYDNENACLVQKVSIIGRYHGQHHSTSLDFDNPAAGPNRYGASYWEHRRFRLGVKVQFLNDFTFYNDFNIHDNDLLTSGSFINNIDTFGIIWEPNDDFYINVGKQKPRITREYTTSSKNILTMERSFIVNEVVPGYMWGTTVGFKALGLSHEVGGFLNAGYERDTPNQGDGPHWPVDNTRGSILYRTGIELNDCTDLFFDYLFTNNSEGQAEAGGNAVGPHQDLASQYNHVFALGTETEWDLGCCDRKTGVITDFIYGVDREGVNGNNGAFPGNNLNAGEDVFGFVILPYYDLTERITLVSRYAYASEAVMQRPQRAPFRQDYDSFGAARPATPILEDVHTFYVGFNYRLCGDKAKLIGGYEYLTADVESSGGRDNGGVTGDTWMIGVRTYW